MDPRNNLFGRGPRGGLPPRTGGGAQYQPAPQQQPAPPQRMSGGYANAPPGYGGGGGGGGGGGRHPQAGRPVNLRLAKVDDKTLQSMYIFQNVCAVSPNDFPPNRDGSDLYVRLTGRELRGDYVVTARPTPGFPDGCISLSDPQRTWCGVAMTDTLVGELYDPFTQGRQAYLGSVDLEVGFASLKKSTEVPYDQEVLGDLVTKTFQNQILAPGQRFLLDVKNIPLALLVKTVQLVDLSMEKMAGTDAPTVSNPGARGILTNQTGVSFFKDAKSPLKLKASSKRPAANSIVSPDFKFEDMGIGGLDTEFSTIFRRAFASRIFPPGLIEKLGIMHVKGMLLYGPPGTGKTLIARQIGRMLNAREPKVINGPEVLNKYVGQSEENIRKLFADAEKEYKEKGDESGLHIIIFDELDAVCKQRGSGAGGGTGVGDSVVNQLLSKLDGVDQLNNILLIGMTNRKDMIDDALLRPGRLEVQIEISLPDEAGRQQILKIHTSKMKENNVMAPDVDITELAGLTKNFSGAELNGLVKSATSFAFNRHIKVGTMAGVSNDVENMKVQREDFFHALDEVKPAFGVSDDELKDFVAFGMIKYSPNIDYIIKDGMSAVEGVRRSERVPRQSVLLHGPDRSGKTALASYIALQSDYPFIKIITPMSLVGFRDEVAKKDQIHKIFSDAYKSPLSILIIDSIEEIIEWNPVGPRLANTVLQALRTLLKGRPPQGHKVLIMVTTSRRRILQELDIISLFDREIAVPAISSLRELGQVIQETKVFEPAEVGEALNELQGYANGADQISVGIKAVMELADGARHEGLQWFVQHVGALVAQNYSQR